MQLPPTDFFSARGDGEDDADDVEDEGEPIASTLDGDSFLTSARGTCRRRCSPGTTAAARESLIGFQQRGVLRRPAADRPRPQRCRPAPRRDRASTMPPTPAAHARRRTCSTRADQLPPASTRRLREPPQPGRGRVHRRARARPARGARPARRIGIVAFSEAQQSEIEARSTALADDDAEFARRATRRSTRARRTASSAGCSSRTSRTSRATSATSSS